MSIIRQCQQVSGMKPGYFKKMRKNEVTIGQNRNRTVDVVTLSFHSCPFSFICVLPANSKEKNYRLGESPEILALASKIWQGLLLYG